MNAKPRPRRIAADEAHAWARNLRLGNPLAKLVLCMLALYVNGDAECFASINQLADDCELDRKTVMARLDWLEDGGLIKRKAQWQDASGARNSDGRGRRTTDLIVLLVEQGERNSTPSSSDPDGPRRGPQKPSGWSKARTTKSEERSVSGPPVVHLGGPPESSEPEPEKTQGEGARAREPVISEAAIKLADQCMLALGLEPEHPPDGWYGLAYDCEVLIKRGCDPPLVLASFAQFKGRTPLPHKNYVLKAVETAHRKPSEPYEKTRRHDPGSSKSDWRSRRDAKHDALAKLNANIEAESAALGEAGCGSDLRVVSDGG